MVCCMAVTQGQMSCFGYCLIAQIGVPSLSVGISMGATGQTGQMPNPASGSPPASLTMQGSPRSKASVTTIPHDSNQSEGASTRHTLERTLSISS
mmetsp:Transcript_4870/g.13291  ORF Transcript_4870/g.13291 Transcript_4870/m.13291 type:complete len:95 (-) Transcript_4870:504-788(-)